MYQLTSTAVSMQKYRVGWTRHCYADCIPQLLLGVPMMPASLNDRVCSNAEVMKLSLTLKLRAPCLDLQQQWRCSPTVLHMMCYSCVQAVSVLSDDSRTRQRIGQLQLQQQLLRLMSDFGACAPSQDGDGDSDHSMPTQNLLFDGQHLHSVDVSEFLQGSGLLAGELA